MGARGDDPGSHRPRRGWERCPGCGVELPGDGEAAGRRTNASAACWALYGEVAGYEIAHLAELGALHQAMVDAYGAQHAGGPAAPIGTAFGLIGLDLAIEHGWSGIEVRDAHHWLGDRYRSWPDFPPPEAAWSMTIFDVAMTDTPETRAAAVRAWAAAVWEGWRGQRERVAALLDERLPDEERRRIHPRS